MKIKRLIDLAMKDDVLLATYAKNWVKTVNYGKAGCPVTALLEWRSRMNTTDNWIAALLVFLVTPGVFILSFFQSEVHFIGTLNIYLACLLILGIIRLKAWRKKPKEFMCFWKAVKLLCDISPLDTKRRGRVYFLPGIGYAKSIAIEHLKNLAAEIQSLQITCGEIPWKAMDLDSEIKVKKDRFLNELYLLGRLVPELPRESGAYFNN